MTKVSLASNSLRFQIVDFVFLYMPFSPLFGVQKIQLVSLLTANSLI